MTPILSIVIPCYNEEDVLPETQRRLSQLLIDLCNGGLAHGSSTVYFVDDGSKDGTWSLIESFCTTDARFHGLKLSRNCGHQNALLAGLLSVPGDVVISIDADLQDDLSVMAAMLEAFRQGHEVVYGVRESRESDTPFKRNTAQIYYKLMRRMGVDLIYNHADYRLMGRSAISALSQFTEINLFLRGIVPLIGYRTTTVSYKRAERFAGESKYPLGKMLAFAWNGITSFSIVPLRLITIVGILVSIGSLFMTAAVLYGVLFKGGTVPGWASSVIPMYFLGGIQLLGIGVLGEYVGKIYTESKRRPRYFVERQI